MIVAVPIAPPVPMAAGTQEQVAACTDRDCVKDEIGALVDTGLPLFCSDCDHEAGYRACGFDDGGAVVATILGWLVTAAAQSLGASFWFALLKRAFRLRSQLASTAS